MSVRNILFATNPVSGPPPVTGYDLWAWGRNALGELGIGDQTNRSSPVQVGALNDWTDINSGSLFGMAVKSDGTLWSWGDNSAGILGLGNTTNFSSPVQVGALTDWSQIVSSKTISTQYHVMAIKTNGTLWAWGRQNEGALGNGVRSTVSISSPIQIGALSDWAQVSCGEIFTAAVKTNGTLWTWGYNIDGALGTNNTTSRSSPAQVGSLSDWAQVSCGSFFMAAVKTNGTLWTWGTNGNGQLGNGNTTSRSSPAQVGSLSNWAQVSCGDSYVVAIKTNGTIWAWGVNSQGGLGLGDTTNRSSPVQVGALSDWAHITAAATASTFAIKTNGTLWAWGSNTFGELGLGDTTNRSSPVQVGALSNWHIVDSGRGSTLALQS